MDVFEPDYDGGDDDEYDEDEDEEEAENEGAEGYKEGEDWGRIDEAETEEWHSATGTEPVPPDGT